MAKKTDIWVYADWIGLDGPELIGTLSAQQAKSRKAFSFSYDKDWIQSDAQRLLDPDIQWFTGAQHPNGKENFGVFMEYNTGYRWLLLWLCNDGMRPYTLSNKNLTATFHGSYPRVFSFPAA